METVLAIEPSLPSGADKTRDGDAGEAPHGADKTRNGGPEETRKPVETPKTTIWEDTCKLGTSLESQTIRYGRANTK